MKALRRPLCLLLALAVLLSACGGEEQPDDTDSPEGISYEHLYQPGFLDWPVGVQALGRSALDGSLAYVVARGEAGADELRLERVDLTDGSHSTLVTLPSGEADRVSTLRAFGAMAVAPDGSLWYHEITEITDNSDSNQGQYTRQDALVHIAADGTPMARLDIGPHTGGAEILSLAADRDGHVAVYGGGRVYAFDSTGALLFSDSALEYARLVCSGPGQVYLREFSHEATRWDTLTLIDFAGRRLGEAVDVTQHLATAFYSGRGGTDVLYTGMNGVYALSLANGTSREVLNFLNHDLAPSTIWQLSLADNGDLYALESSRQTVDAPIAPLYLQWVGNMDFDPDDPDTYPPILKGKKVLTYGAVYISAAVKALIRDFNQTNAQYRIVTVEYYEAAQMDFNLAYEMMSMDFLTGKAPDIFDVTVTRASRPKWGQWALDLYPFLDADPEYGRDAFLPNVLSALEYEGTLPVIASELAVATVAGKQSILGDRLGWTFEELKALEAGLPKGTQLFGDMDKLGLLGMYLQYATDEYVDLASGTCRFDSEDFLALLRWCQAQPDTPKFTYDTGMSESLESVIARLDEDLRADRVLLANCTIDSPRMIRQYQEVFGEAVSFIGRPTVQGYGGVFVTPTASSMFSISATCQYPQGAWAFIRELFAPDRLPESGLATTHARLKSQLALDMTPLAERAPRDRVHYWSRDLGGRWGTSFTASIEASDPRYDSYHLTEAEAAQLMAIIDAVPRWAAFEGEVWPIVQETAAAYFAGQRSAEETAGIIQNRVSTLLSERS